MILAFLTSRLTPYIAGLAALALIAWFIWDRGGDARDAKQKEKTYEAITAAEAASRGRSECGPIDVMFWDFAAGECTLTGNGPRR